MSDIDWGKVGDLVGKAAPLIGGLLFGPAGAGVGSLVAHALGTEDSPDAVAKELQTNPDAYLKLKELELRHKERFEELQITATTKQIEAVNLTMQAETKSDRWWVSGWRPFWGFTAAIAFFAQTGFMGYMMVEKPDEAAEVIKSLTALDGYWLVPLAILGVASYHRGQEKRAKVGDQRTLFGGLLNR